MNDLASLFKALSEPVRLRILNLLQDGELCVCDLMAVLDLPQSTVSRHLGRLSRAGLVEGRREGKWMHYRLSESLPEPGRNIMTACRNLCAPAPQAAEDREALARRIRECGPDRCGCAGHHKDNGAKS